MPLAELCCLCCCAVQCYICGMCRKCKNCMCPPDHKFPRKPDEDSVRIVFTSCSHQTAPKVYFNNMKNLQPDLIILTGDSIYIDALSMCGDFGYMCIGSGICIKRPEGGDLDHKECYDQLTSRDDFGLVGSDETVLVTWDDHDFGANDIFGPDYGQKAKAKRDWIEFVRKIDSKTNNLTDQLAEMESDPDRGVYYVYDFDKGDIRMRIYMLDNRWERTDTDVLGPVQMEWLQGVVTDAKNQGIDRHVFVNGSNVVTPHVNAVIMKLPTQTWPSEARLNFIQFLKDNDIYDKSYLLSGDIHMSLVSQKDGLYEYVSSAMTHSLITPMFKVYDWAVCAKQYLCCGCGADHGWHASDLGNENGFAVLDIFKDRVDYGVIQGDDCDDPQDLYQPTVHLPVDYKAYKTI